MNQDRDQPGRPRKDRVAAAGDKLRMAFMLLEKTWGSNTAAPNHIFNMKRWGFCGLPKSLKTVKEDIRRGVSYDRMFKYASLLNVPAPLLADEAVRHTDPAFIASVVKGKSDAVPPAIMLQNVFGPAVSEKFLDFNRPEYIGELFELLAGLYIVYLAKAPLDVGINKMALAIHGTDVYCLKARGRFHLETEPVAVEGELHRWGSFLHANFFMREIHSFGLAMLPDPLHNPLVAARRPFHLTGKYLLGSEAFGHEPLFAVLHMERRQKLPDTGWEEAFEAFCQENVNYQFLFAGDPEYDYALSRLHGAGEGGLLGDAG